MNPPSMSPFQTIGNICVAIAGIIYLLPLQHLLWNYAPKKSHLAGWETRTLLILIPLWLLLLGALLCVTATGGFDSLRLGRPSLHAFTVAAGLALGAVSFLSVAFYMRPGFIPRYLFCPPIYLIPLATLLLAILSLNPQLAPGISPAIVRWPWMIVAGLSLVAGAGWGGYQLVRWSAQSAAGMVHRFRHPGPSTQETLAHIATLEPQRDFADLLNLASRYQRQEVREAATARLRADPRFLETLVAELESGHVEPAVTFLYSATLSPAERARLARPARKALERWVNRIPAANYTTKKNLKDLRRWGTEMLGVLSEKFAGTGVDFAPVMDDLKDKVEPAK